MSTLGFDRKRFEDILVVELGREAFATDAEMLRIIRSVVESDTVRSVLDDHDGSDFGQWRAVNKRYPERLATRVEDSLGYAGYSLFLRLNREAFHAWRSDVARSVQRAVEKAALPAAA